MYSVTISQPRPYHHGDLRNALVRAAADLAESGGPEAVTIRAAARQVGVTPTATYRHFASQSELLHAAKHEALDRMTATILALLTEPDPEADPVTVVLDRLVAAGRGYVQFAMAQPGLFRTAFCRGGGGEGDEGDEMDPAEALAAAPPYAFLSQVLDDLVEVGWLDPSHREGAEMAAWSTVHGLSMLMLDGPCADMPADEREQLIRSTLALVVRGLAGGPASR
jgi:AcrR family transcriptional regulator